MNGIKHVEKADLARRMSSKKVPWNNALIGSNPQRD